MSTPLLDIQNLRISFLTEKEKHTVVHDISFALHQNEILGIVGESGSGKSVSSSALMGLLPRKTAKVEGQITYQSINLLNHTEKEWQKWRGNKIAMIFQEPMSALNPSMRLGQQVAEVLLKHQNLSKSEAKKQVISLFDKVKLPQPEILYRKYPHQISGGQMQRVMIAMAIACKPQVLIADEPTTALDVTVQKEIILLLRELQQETGMSVIFITHDLALISQIADRVIVMYQGKIIEQGRTMDIFNHPQQDYTKALLFARPKLDQRLERLPTIANFLEKQPLATEITSQQRALRHKKIYSQPPLLEVFNLKKQYFSKVGWFQKKQVFTAVDGVSFQLYEGETLGLVGESGCGKSTLAKTLLQLDPPTSGTVLYRGKDISSLPAKDWRQLRKEIQIIFQDPYSSLHPRMLIGEAILETMRVHQLFKNRKERIKQVHQLLTEVGLNEAFYHRYPHELSGGQRQRVGIARTIALSPRLIVCDESVSALDISVQAQVLNLLNRLKDQFGFSYLFISHDLAVVKYMADQLMVMKSGKLEEIGEADEIYANPQSNYTQKLIAAIPEKW